MGTGPPEFPPQVGLGQLDPTHPGFDEGYESGGSE